MASSSKKQKLNDKSEVTQDDILEFERRLIEMKRKLNPKGRKPGESRTDACQRRCNHELDSFKKMREFVDTLSKETQVDLSQPFAKLAADLVGEKWPKGFMACYDWNFSPNSCGLGFQHSDK